MVTEQLLGRGIKDALVISAMRVIPRHEFVPQKNIHLAYEDSPVSIGEGQTVSQPFIVALMTQSLQLTEKDRVLEIGTGCGYQTAILARICRDVHTVERLPGLAYRAQETLQRQGYHNIKFHIGDGTLGWPEDLSFDAVIVTAASPHPLDHLLDRLNDEGRMIVPIGDEASQALTLFEKKEGKVKSWEICRCVFVPLVGKWGWPE